MLYLGSGPCVYYAWYRDDLSINLLVSSTLMHVVSNRRRIGGLVYSNTILCVCDGRFVVLSSKLSTCSTQIGIVLNCDISRIRQKNSGIMSGTF